MTGLPFQMKFYCTVIEYLVALLQTGLAYHTCQHMGMRLQRAPMAG